MTNNEILAGAFEKAMKETLPEVIYSVVGTLPVEFVIPAKSEAFGEIRASMDESEVTVSLGRVHHTHCTCYGAITGDSLRCAAEDAVQIIKDVLEERIYVRVYHAEDRVLGSSFGYQPENSQPFSQQTRFVDTYIWSGLVSRVENPAS